MISRVALNTQVFGWLVRVTPVELWEETLPGESSEEAAARRDAAADISAELLAEAASEGVAAP